MTRNATKKPPRGARPGSQRETHLRRWGAAQRATVVADVLRWLRNVVLVPRERGP